MVHNPFSVPSEDATDYQYQRFSILEQILKTITTEFWKRHLGATEALEYTLRHVEIRRSFLDQLFFEKIQN